MEMVLRHCLYQLSEGPSYGLVSLRDDKDTAVIFVHGFQGDPINTWTQFQVYIDCPCPSELSGWWATADLYFYGYNSLKGSISEQAVMFREFAKRSEERRVGKECRSRWSPY